MINANIDINSALVSNLYTQANHSIREASEFENTFNVMLDSARVARDIESQQKNSEQTVTDNTEANNTTHNKNIDKQSNLDDTKERVKSNEDKIDAHSASKVDNASIDDKESHIAGELSADEQTKVLDEEADVLVSSDDSNNISDIKLEKKKQSPKMVESAIFDVEVDMQALMQEGLDSEAIELESYDGLMKKIKDIKKNIERLELDSKSSKESKAELASIIVALDALQLATLQNIETIKESKDNKEVTLKRLDKDSVDKSRLNLQEIEKLINKMSHSVDKTEPASPLEFSDVKEELNSFLSKSKLETPGDKLAQSKQKPASNDGFNPAVNDIANNTNDNATELNIVRMRESSKIETPDFAPKTQPLHREESDGTITRFTDMMSRMVDKAKMAVSEGKSEIVMTLKPEHLGNVKLKMTMEGDNLIGKIFVENAEIRDIFTKNIDTVIKSLSEININIEGLDVMLSQDTPQQEQAEFDALMDMGEKRGSRFAGNAMSDNLIIDKYLLPERRVSILI